MFQYATNHPKKKALLTVKNLQDLTPINLAAKLARKDIFKNILELQNLVQNLIFTVNVACNHMVL